MTISFSIPYLPPVTFETSAETGISFYTFLTGMRVGGGQAALGMVRRDRILFPGTAECFGYHAIHGFSCGFLTSTPVF
jgi:hypothetical protein